MMSTLRMQNFPIIGRGVPGIRGGTDTRLSTIYTDIKNLKCPGGFEVPMVP